MLLPILAGLTVGFAAVVLVNARMLLNGAGSATVAANECQPPQRFDRAASSGANNSRLRGGVLAPRHFGDVVAKPFARQRVFSFRPVRLASCAERSMCATSSPPCCRTQREPRDL